MNKELKLKLIEEAQRLLVQNPQNILHDITHHYRTLQFARKIIKNEKLEVDQDIVEIICWWHDVEIQNKNSKDNKRVVEITAEYISKKVPKKYKEKVYDSVLNHEFKSKVNFLEGEVLQDADKLDILSISRFESALEAVEAGILDKDWLFNKVINVLETEWLPEIMKLYHFDFSKRCHRDKLPEFMSYLEKVRDKA